MTRQQVFAAITGAGVIPIVRTASAESAIQAAEAVHRGGLHAVEISMTVPGAIRAIEQLADRFGDSIILGAGTVLDPETARACMLAGAQFFVTPNLRLSTIEIVKRYSKVIFPGALTPTEVLTAWESGADAVKIFPCGSLGGPSYIKALKGPFPQIEMTPTGGVTVANAGEFIRAGACAVAAGSELVDEKLMRGEGGAGIVEERARQFLTAVAEARSAGI